MKRNLKLLSLLLALALVAGLMAGCGSSSSSTETTTEETTTETEETTAASEAAAAEEEPEAEAETETEAAAAPSSATTVTEDGTATVANVVSDPLEAMAEEFITYPLEGEDNVITIWYYIPGYVEYMDSNYNYNAVSAAEEATGVRLEFTEVSDSAATELFNLMISSGDMCDLIPVLEYYTGGLAKAYEEDIIIDISDYVDEYMPNYAAVMECLDPQTVSDTLTDDHLLAFYQIADGTYSANGVVTRADWLEELGYEFSGDLISLDEYTELLRTFQTEFGATYGYYMYDGTMPLEAAFDTEIPALVGDGFMTQVTSAIFRYGDTVTSGWITDGYREYIEWIRQMMDEGILYEDFLSLDSDQGTRNQLIGLGETATWQSNADKIEEIVESYASDNPDLAVVAMPRVTADPDAQYVWNDETALVSTNSGFSISTDCENPELVCQWANYFWTTDGYMMANYGVEGESYDVNDDGSIEFTWQRPVTVTGKNAPNAEMAQNLFTMMRFVGFYSDNDRLLSTFPDSALDAVDLWTIEGSTDDRNYPSAVSAGFTTEESEEIAQYEGDLLTYTAETCMKFMTGALELTDETWAEYVANCEAMGINEIIAVYQNAYDEYLAGER